VVGGAVVGSEVVGPGPAVVGSLVCPGAWVVWPGAVEVFCVVAVVALLVPVAAGSDVLVAVSEEGGDWRPSVDVAAGAAVV
jgi:hypothetical protein